MHLSHHASHSVYCRHVGRHFVNLMLAHKMAVLLVIRHLSDLYWISYILCRHLVSCISILFNKEIKLK